MHLFKLASKRLIESKKDFISTLGKDLVLIFHEDSTSLNLKDPQISSHDKTAILEFYNILSAADAHKIISLLIMRGVLSRIESIAAIYFYIHDTDFNSESQAISKVLDFILEFGPSDFHFGDGIFIILKVQQGMLREELKNSFWNKKNLNFSITSEASAANTTNDTSQFVKV